MPGPLKNSKHEAFVQAVFAGSTQTDAYEAHVGHSETREAAQAGASRVFNRPDVQERLNELKAGAATITTITREMLVQRMLDTADDAKAKGVHSAAIRGYELLGRDKGAFQERKTVTVRSLADLTEEDLLNELAALDASNPDQAESGHTGRVGKAGNGKAPARRSGRVIN